MPSSLKPKPTGQVKQQVRQRRHSDFSELYTGRLITVTLANGTVLKGILTESRRFWIQLMVDGKPYFINKAYIAIITPG